MVKCSFCGRNIKGLPYKCHRCNGSYCDNHRLPEDHHCPGLEKEKSKNQERWRKAFKSSSYQHEEKKDRTVTHRKTNPFKKLYYKFKYWLTNRQHRAYRYSRFQSYVFPLLIKFIVSLVAIIIIYSNLIKINDVGFWIIKLGSVLFLIGLFFLIKYSIKLLSEIWNWIKRQRNWLKYLIIIIFLVLLWQAYDNRTTVLNPVFDYYNQTNFSAFWPLNLGNFEWKDEISFDYGNDADDTKTITIPTSTKGRLDERQIELEVHRLINVQRSNNGLSSLSLDSKLSDISRAHSEDMVNRNFYSHTNPDGEEPSDRGNKADYYCSKSLGGGWYTDGIAENIAMTPVGDVIGCGYVYDETDVAECTVNGWMNSPGHKENILTAVFDKEGVGVAIKSNEVYITQNFC